MSSNRFLYVFLYLGQSCDHTLNKHTCHFHFYFSQGCSTSEQRADRIISFLREKGLEGEPSIENCKQLKTDLRIRREIEGLDPNVIIQGDSEGNKKIKLISSMLS